MAPMKKGTPTGFKDRAGREIKVGDRIRNIRDGLVMHIDKFGGAVAPASTRYPLRTLDLSDWELYAGEFVPVPEEHCVRGEDMEPLSRLGYDDLRRRGRIVEEASFDDRESVQDAARPAEGQKEKADIRLDPDAFGSLLDALESAVISVTKLSVGVKALSRSLSTALILLKDKL